MFSRGPYLWGKPGGFDGAIALGKGLYALLNEDLFNALTQTLGVRYDNVTLGFDFIGGGLNTSIVLGIGTIASLVGQLSEPFFQPVYDPFGVLTMSECLPEVLHFFMEKLRFVAYCFGPVDKCINYTIFG